ncbi:hypothetical protein [Leucobacter sp. gxy201]|uniref:hypothetical protein n=1 Tax=Leucobacter sp. gxy201 TaxID=2957200 RepID=UPI003DA116A3
MSTDVRRRASTAPLVLAALLGVTGCGVIPDRVTDCDTSSQPLTCQRDERFELAGTSIVVDEIDTITEIGGDPADQAHVEARVTLEGEPESVLEARLHVVNPLTEETLTVAPDTRPVAGEQTLTWDFSGRGYAERIQTDAFPPDIRLVFSDADHEVTVIVMSVEYSWEAE